MTRALWNLVVQAKLMPSKAGPAPSLMTAVE
jgi:hypothetical protein